MHVHSSAMTNFHFLEKALIFKASHFFPFHFFLFQKEESMAYIVGKNFAYLWIFTLGSAKQE